MDEKDSASMEHKQEIKRNFIPSTSGLAVMTIASGPPKIKTKPVVRESKLNENIIKSIIDKQDETSEDDSAKPLPPLPPPKTSQSYKIPSSVNPDKDENQRASNSSNNSSASTISKAGLLARRTKSFIVQNRAVSTLVKASEEKKVSRRKPSFLKSIFNRPITSKPGIEEEVQTVVSKSPTVSRESLKSNLSTETKTRAASIRISTESIENEQVVEPKPNRNSQSSQIIEETNYRKKLVNFRRQSSTHRNSINFLGKMQNNGSNPAISAAKSMEMNLGPEITRQLIFDYSNKIPVRKQSTIVSTNSDRNSIDSNTTTEEISSSISDTSIASNSSMNSPLKPTKVVNSKLNKPIHELNAERRRKADEYYNIEQKQANLLKLLKNNVYEKFRLENEKQQFALCDKESMDKIFNILVILSSFADLVHGEVAMKIKKRVDSEWTEMPFFGDILVPMSQYYKTYKPVLERFTDTQLALSNMLKKKNFASYLKKLLENESEGLDKVNRIDILFDRLVDFPRRIIQLLESYLKFLEPDSKEYEDIASVLDMFTTIFVSSNNEMNKMQNFQACLNLQQIMIESSNFKEDIANADHPLIKQGPIYKVAKRNGELQLRHLALFTNKLIVSKIEKMALKKTLKPNYKINGADIKLIKNSDETDELRFRLISSDQNNEFMADRVRDKEDWIKAFRKMHDIEMIETLDTRYSNNNFSILQIGVDPPVWIPDNAQERCSGCKEAFNVYKRRHHCRTCGKIYCAECSNYKVAVKFTEFKNKVRVCKTCFHFLDPIYQEYEQKHGNIHGNSKLHLSYSALTQRLKDNRLKAKDAKNSLLPENQTETESQNDVNEPNETNNETEVIVKRRIKSEKSHDSSSASSLTEEQMEVISTLNLDYANKNLPFEDEEEEEEEENSNSYEELNEMTTAPQDTNLIVKIEKSNSISKIRPPISPKPSPETVMRRSKQSFSSESSEQLISPRAINKLSILNKLKREVIESEYGYLCKIPIVKNEFNMDSEEEELKDANNLKKKWDRYLMVLYSDKTIGICTNQNETKNPSLIIQLALFTINEVDETTFALTTIDKENDKPTDTRESVEPQADINDFKEISRNSNLKKRLKQFETNYEIKFTNKMTKKKWYDLLMNSQQVKSEKVTSSVL